MKKIWVILAGLVFLGGVSWVLIFPAKAYTRDEVSETLRTGSLGSGWVVEVQRSVAIGPTRGVFERLFNKNRGGSGMGGGDVFEWSKGKGRATIVVYYDGNHVDVIEIRRSRYANELKQQLQRKFPGIPCRILSN